MPDNEMPHTEDGKAMQVLLTANGVISRTNPGSLTEAALGRVAKKTGKHFNLEHYEKGDNLQFAIEELKKNGIDEKVTLINPATKKPFPNKVFYGKPNIMKLFKDSESAATAIGLEATDINEIPRKGGKSSASSVSDMEVNALLSHGAGEFLKEVRDLKGQKNDEFFTAFRNGLPTPPLAENFAFGKFKTLIEQLGVTVKDDRYNKKMSLMPMTDKEVLERSAGRVLKPETVRAKNNAVIKDGLFDDSIFGGVAGERYGHIKLPVKIINPIMKDDVAKLLGISTKELLHNINKKGKDYIIEVEKKLSSINIPSKIKELENESLSTKNEQVVDRNIKTIKFLRKINSAGPKAKLQDYALTQNITVIPTKYRTVSVDKDGQPAINDLNIHYLDIIKTAKDLQNSNKNSPEVQNELFSDLYHSVGALYGIEKSHNPMIERKEIKGVLDILGGNVPKESYIHKNMLKKNQFMSGRAVIRPTRDDLDIDYAEIPIDIGLKAYEPHIAKEMSKMGFTPLQIEEMIKNKDEAVIKTLHRLGKEIPAVINRAPSLHKFNMLGQYPKFVEGSVVGLSANLENSLGSDYDGDCYIGGIFVIIP